MQEAWASPASPISLPSPWSNGGTSYSGSGVTPLGTKHGVTAFQRRFLRRAARPGRAGVAAIAAYSHQRRWARPSPAVDRLQRSERAVRSHNQRRWLRRWRSSPGQRAGRWHLRASGPRAATRIRASSSSRVAINRPHRRQKTGAVKVFRYDDGRLHESRVDCAWKGHRLSIAASGFSSDATVGLPDARVAEQAGCLHQNGR